MPASREQLQQTMKALVSQFHDKFTGMATELISQQIPITELNPILVATACGKALLHCSVVCIAAGHQLSDEERQVVTEKLDVFVRELFAPFNQRDLEALEREPK